MPLESDKAVNPNLWKIRKKNGEHNTVSRQTSQGLPGAVWRSEKKKGSFHHKGELYWWDGEPEVALKVTTISKQKETNGDTSACFLFNQWETPIHGMCSPHSGRIFLLHVNVSEDIIRNALEDIPRGVKCPRWIHIPWQLTIAMSNLIWEEYRKSQTDPTDGIYLIWSVTFSSKPSLSLSLSYRKNTSLT